MPKGYHGHQARAKQGAKLLGRIAALEEIFKFVEELGERSNVVNTNIILSKIKRMIDTVADESKEFSKNA